MLADRFAEPIIIVLNQLIICSLIIVYRTVNFWGRRLTLRFDYFGYHDDASATADFSFDFDDDTFPENADLDSNLDLDLYVINLSYNFIRTDRASFGPPVQQVAGP